MDITDKQRAARGWLSLTSVLLLTAIAAVAYVVNTLDTPAEYFAEIMDE